MTAIIIPPEAPPPPAGGAEPHPLACSGCRYAIDDLDELAQEFEHLERNYPLFKRSERLLGPTGAAQGARVERVVDYFNNFAAVLYQQHGIPPTDIILCEKGMFHVGSRRAVIDCPHRTPRSDVLAQIRPADWRRKREAMLALATKPADRSRVGMNDPCPCGSGKAWGVCCYKASAG